MVLRKKEQKARHEMGGKTDKIPGILKKGPKMSQGHYAPETFKMWGKGCTVWHFTNCHLDVTWNLGEFKWSKNDIFGTLRGYEL